MKICVPTESDAGLAAMVAGHLGRAPFLTLVDTESDQVVVMPNAPHGEGHCAPARPLSGTGVEAVVCGGAGKRAVASLQKAGIRVLLTTALRVDEAVSAVRQGELRVLQAKDACGGHHHHEGSESERCARHGSA